jgi:hypothetical protein
MIKKLLLWLLEKNSRNHGGFSDTKVYESGIYRSKNQYITLSKGETFPPSLYQATFWRLVVSV